MNINTSIIKDKMCFRLSQSDRPLCLKLQIYSLITFLTVYFFLNLLCKQFDLLLDCKIQLTWICSNVTEKLYSR